MRSGRSGEEGGPGDGNVELELEVVDLVEVELLVHAVDTDDTTTLGRSRPAQRLDLVSIGPATGDRLPVGAEVGDGETGGKPDGAGRHGVTDQLRHLGDLAGFSSTAGRFVAHHEQTQWGVADVLRHS
ncbi:MAG: hypothetical protein R2710_02175 [Acidimicrobiales bacterium]